VSKELSELHDRIVFLLPRIVSPELQDRALKWLHAYRRGRATLEEGRALRQEMEEEWALIQPQQPRFSDFAKALRQAVQALERVEREITAELAGWVRVYAEVRARLLLANRLLQRARRQRSARIVQRLERTIRELQQLTAQLPACPACNHRPLRYRASENRLYCPRCKRRYGINDRRLPPAPRLD